MTRALPTRLLQSMPEPDETGKAMRDTLVALKKNVEVLTGQVKPSGLTAVTWSDLVALGVADVNDLPAAGAGAPGGYVLGELGSGAPVNLTSGIALNVVQITLPTADIYDVWFNAFFSVAAGTSIFTGAASISSIANTVQSSPLDRVNYANMPAGGFLGAGNNGQLGVGVGPARIVVSGPTTIFGVVAAVFSGTVGAYGTLRASRQ